MRAMRGESRVLPAAAVALAMSASLLWAAGPDLKVQLQGSYQSAENPRGKWVSLKGGTQVSPGDHILYKVEIANRGDREARNPVAFGPIPAGTTLVAGSATQAPELTVEYSIDGGKTYSASPTVTTVGQDGKPQTVPASMARYTTVRWLWSSVLPAGAKASVSYQVVVR